MGTNLLLFHLKGRDEQFAAGEGAPGHGCPSQDVADEAREGEKDRDARESHDRQEAVAQH